MKLYIVFCLLFIFALADPVSDNVQKLLTIASGDKLGYDRLCEICDEIGPRIAGTQGYVDGANMVEQMMKQDKFDRVWRHTAPVTAWVPQGYVHNAPASLVMVKPYSREMHPIIPLGRAPGTPPQGITAPILVVRNFDELTARAGEVPGKIVVFNEDWNGYGVSVQYRAVGPRTALQLGAVACLVRSVTGYSLQSSHTGITAPANIPSAAITPEDAMMLQRMQDRYPSRQIVMRLVMSCGGFNDTVMHDSIIGDIIGTRWPEQIVIVSGHLDSWVSPGAQDDLSGAMAAWNAARYIIKAGIKPKRTIRTIAWVSEEFGGEGGQQYAKDFANVLSNYSVAMEFDDGIYDVTSFGVTTTDAGVAELQALTNRYLNGLTITNSGGGVDIGPMGSRGVPTASFSNPEFAFDNGTYWNIHHTTADTPDKLDPAVLARVSGKIAVLAYLISDMDHLVARNPQNKFKPIQP